MSTVGHVHRFPSAYSLGHVNSFYHTLVPHIVAMLECVLGYCYCCCYWLNVITFRYNGVVCQEFGAGCDCDHHIS